MTRREEIEYSQRTKEFFMKRDLNKPLCINTAIEWADTTMLNKVCEWLKENIWVYINYEGCSGEELENDVIEDFRKAMEE